MIPKPILDLGAGVVIVFIVLLIILAILKIIQTVKGGKNRTQQDEVVIGRGTCLQSPQLQTIMTNQALTQDATKRIEALLIEMGKGFTQNQAILGQLARTTRLLAVCMAKKVGTSIVTEGDDVILPGQGGG